MLFILTGDVQIGKTRWLEQLVGKLLDRGVVCAGVLAPGVWREGNHGERDKVGIDNVLLPQQERFSFATRRDLLDAPTGRATSQSDGASLGWAIYDEALQTVNEHLESLCCPESSPTFLIVDELGRLELERSQGLVTALRLLDAGPRPHMPHALIVVRDWLAEGAARRFAPVWGEPTVIAPDDQGEFTVFDILGRTADCAPFSCKGAGEQYPTRGTPR